MAELRYVRAIATALGDALAEDESVIVFGEDVSSAGGAFGASRGLRDRFGAERVRDTPLSEAAPMINRYSSRKLVLGDDSLGSVKISGVLRADNLEALQEMLAENSGIKAEVRAHEIVLTHR